MKRSSFIKGIGLATSGLILPGPKSISLSNLYTQPVKIYDNFIRGTYYYALHQVFDSVKEGDSIELKRIPKHKHDSFAVEVVWNGEYKLRYMAAFENVVLAYLMDSGIPLHSLITEKRVPSQMSVGIWGDLVISGKTGNPLADKRAGDQEDMYRGHYPENDIIL